jgi:hypothetical protein
LPDSGRVTRKDADRKAQQEFDLFERRRRAEVEAKAEAELISQVELLAKQAKRPRRAKLK